jgi:hypothetical protein
VIIHWPWNIGNILKYLIPCQYIMKFIFSKLFVHFSIWFNIYENLFSNIWYCLIGFKSCVLHPLIWLVMKLFFKFSTNGYPSLLCSKGLFSCSMQISSYISSLLNDSSSQILFKLVPMSSFIKISMKLQVEDPTHEQIKYLQSSIKSTQIWSSINNSSLRINPLPTNPIDSNQLNLKL